MALRNRIGIILTTVAVALSLAQPAAAQPVLAPAKPGTSNKTVIKYVTPFTKTGKIKRKVQEGSFDASSCTGTTVSKRAGVYTCGSAADYLPACWRTSKLFGFRVMVCMNTPQAKRNQIAAVSGKLPKATKPQLAEPWQIRLDDGGVCAVRVGGAWVTPPDGYGYTYSCSGSSVQALVALDGAATLDTSARHYTVGAVTEMGASDAAVTTVGVKKVIYAGATPKVAKKKAKERSKCPSDAQLERQLHRGQTLIKDMPTVCSGRWAGAFVDIAGEPNFDQVLFHRTGKHQWKQVNWAKRCFFTKKIPAPFATFCLASL